MKFKICKSDGTEKSVCKDTLLFWLERRTKAGYTREEIYTEWFTKALKSRNIEIYFRNIEVCGYSFKENRIAIELNAHGQTYNGRAYFKPEAKVKVFYIIKDEYDRILSPDLLKDLMKDRPNAYNVPGKEFYIAMGYPRRYRCYYRHKYPGFRNGPVPNTAKRKNGWWHQNRGEHGHTQQEVKQYYRDIIDQKIMLKEYGVTFKIHRKPVELNPWNHAHHGGSKGKTWKRTRIEKQWMRKNYRK